MIKANDLNKISKQEIIELVLKKIEANIVAANEEGKRHISLSVERNGWFDCEYKSGEKISWGAIIYDIMEELEDNGYSVYLHDSYGTISYTKLLMIDW